MNEMRTALNFLQDPGVKNTTEIPHHDKKIEMLSQWVNKLQNQVRVNTKGIDLLEAKARQSNLIIEGMEEISNEDIISSVSGLLSRFVPSFSPSWIRQAYRLGRQMKGANFRKILVSFVTPEARDEVFNQAGPIARAGMPGARIFINEDATESTKRKTADLRKYTAFLQTKGISAQIKGEGIILDGKLYHYEDLSHMPNGLTLKDSRTKQRTVCMLSRARTPLCHPFLNALSKGTVLPIHLRSTLFSTPKP